MFAITNQNNATNARAQQPRRAGAGMVPAIAAAIAAMAVFAGAPAQAQTYDANGIARTEIVRHDLDSGHEAIQVRVDFAPGASFPDHSHPGVEIAYVLEGRMEYVLNGQSIILKAGQSLYIPAGAVHNAKNLGLTKASELATYMVQKNTPIVVLAK
jgi:quercetin dioxygenase-like cupin family protein